MLKIAAILTLPLAIGAGVVASTSFLVVDVREAGPDGMHIVLPVPLALAQMGLAFAPKHATRVELPPEAEQYRPMAEKMLAVLADAPDGEFVRVEEPGERVTIAKVAGVLEIRVHSHSGEDVAVNVPLAAVSRIVRHQGALDASDVISALRQVSRTDLVEVRDGKDHVKVWIW